MSLLLPIADTRNPSSLASKFRRKRYELFRRLFETIPKPVRILDVGGTEAFWSGSDLLQEDDVEITVLNVDLPSQANPRIQFVTGDARKLEFPDKSFDIVYSNSVIEHVGRATDQARMADEIKRVGCRYFVQTPNFFFPIEPHFLVPCFQFMPINARALLLRSFDLGWTKREPELSSARAVVESVRLLRRAEVVALFPDATIYDERIFGLSKSFVAYFGFVESPTSP